MAMLFGCLISYFIGAIPTAFLFAKRLKGIDIREHGSGNVGATNAVRVIGKVPGAIVLVLDFLKGFLPTVLLAGWLMPLLGYELEFIRASFGLAAVLGHVFSVFLKFKGGKGVATSAGVVLGISPVALLIGVLFFALTVFCSGYVSLGSIVCAIVIPFYLAFRGYHTSYIILAAILCIIIVFKHKSNIGRLLAGRENKIFKK